jgi:iron-sulfur cluster repair protein YtfE (RIC family)
MSSTDFGLDMSMMYVIHDALRRELIRIARYTSRTSDDPMRILRTAVGWEMFKTYLHAHHTAEDETLWPVMAQVLADRPADLALLEAMEAEHAAIDPLVTAVDTALADRADGPRRIGGLVDALRSTLGGHLTHEETQALPLIDHTVTEQQWDRLGQRQAEKIGGDASRYLPWLLDNLDPQRAAAVLARMPAPLRASYEAEWRAAYRDIDLWPTTGLAAPATTA